MCSLEFYFGLQFDFGFLSYYLFFIFYSCKCYFIAYKYSLQEYNVILLYIMVWIIWCLTYNYILSGVVALSRVVVCLGIRTPFPLPRVCVFVSQKKKFLNLLFLILFPISLSKKVITLSLSLSLSLSLYIYIYMYSFLQLYFRLMNHCIFYIILFWVNMIWYCV